MSPAGPAGNKPAESNWWSRIRSGFETATGRVRNGYETMKPCRLALIVVAMVPLIFIFVEQAGEVLRCLAEGPAHTGGARLERILWITFGLTSVSLTGWWFSLVLLYFKFPDTPDETTPRTRALMKWLPPVIGVIPSFGLGLACMLAASPVGDQLPSRFLKILGAVCFVYGAVFFLWFKWKQNSDLFQGSTSFHALQTGYKKIVYVALMMSSLLFLTLLLWPVDAAQAMGTTTLILLAAASWIVYGSVAVYVGQRLRLPVIRLALLGVILFSFWNNNHDIRYLATAPPPTVPAFEDQYCSWYSNLCARYPGEQPPPVIIVAAAGGGIRAALWTATVLGELQDRNPAFADHVFAISGVSGGSLGAAVFAGLMKNGNAKSNRAQAQRVLAHDFLSPALAYLLFPDMVQQFLPFRVRSFDRATALEKAWESAWKHTTGNDLFNQDFFSLWQGTNSQSVPSLFLNGTSVENGQRMVVSNIRLDGLFIVAKDINAQLTNSIRLSTAVDMSTRFCYVSPSGRFKDRRHVVDGGYFENSGTATVSDILDDIDSAEYGRTNLPAKIVIVISNDPQEGREIPPRSDFLGEVLTPFDSLMSARDARGTYSETLLRMRVETNFFKFSLKQGSQATNEVPLPLGWSLSKLAIKEMNERLQQQEGTPFAVLDRLPRKTVPRLP
jgi:predicted acylesterase/phospholipase RssA